ncbi:MAG TPA: type II secretion system F family protein [Acidimicrobiales bacterium]|nr:type II secretion system F family protein [Acidimicrobiales bacterium]
MSDVAVALALGAAAGAALVGAGRALVPPRVSLDDALAGLRRLPEAPRAEPEAGFTGPVANRLGWMLRRTAESAGVSFARLGPDLRLLGRPIENHLGAKCVAALAGFALPTLWAAAMSSAGLAAVRPTSALLAGGVLALLGFLVPDLLVRSEAAERRRAFVSAFGTFLDMVAISLAGGVGVEGALMDAARIGRGREAALLRAVLEEALWSGESQWSALRRLGVDLAIPEVVEVASTVSLAGTEGARVRRSLEAKARALRGRELAEAEARAESATERMAIPTALLMLGFMLLVGFPAIASVLTQA